jgi:hypothetical protein
MTPVDGSNGVTYKLANHGDMIAYYGGNPPYSSKSIIFYKDGEMIGIGGYKIDCGNFVIFSEIKENARLNKQTIWRCGRVIMDFIKGHGIKMLAVSSNKKLCEALGLIHVGEELFLWQ